MTDLFVKFNPGLLNYLLRLKGVSLSVFMAIALHTGKMGTAYPSIKRICRLTGYNKRAVIYALRKLERWKFIRIMETGRNTGGRFSSNLYALTELVGFGSEEQIQKAFAANWPSKKVEIKEPELQE
jgi:hypothetical protein